MTQRLVSILVLALALLALAGVVSADGGINGAANGYFGGDTLFCNNERGCWLLNSNSPANGSVPVLLGEFAQADIQAALESCAANGANATVGTIQGTFGPFTLSAVYDGPNANPVCSLQINASESSGKESKPYTFEPAPDGNYDPIDTPPETGKCKRDLAALGWYSVDGSHYGEGFDVMDYSKPDEWTGVDTFFIDWVSNDPGFPTCPESVG